MLIDKDKAVNEIIDGYDAAGVPDNLIADRLDSAGYSLAKQIDTDGATTLIAGSTVVSAATLTKDNIYGKLVDLRTAMSKANIPNDGKRYFLVTPDTMALILNAPEFVKASDLGDAVVQTGAVGKIAGFLIIEWNDETPNLAGIAGHPRFATRAEEFSVPVHIQDLAQSGNYIGASAVQGRDAYGHKVLRSAAIRALFAPGVTTVSVAVGTSAAGDTKVTATLGTANSGGSLAYKKNPSSTIAYGTTSTAYAGTSMTTETATVIKSCVAGDIIEVAEFDSTGACISCAYITLVASQIKA